MDSSGDVSAPALLCPAAWLSAGALVSSTRCMKVVNKGLVSPIPSSRSNCNAALDDRQSHVSYWDVHVDLGETHEASLRQNWAP